MLRADIGHSAGEQLSGTRYKKEAGNLARYEPGLMVCIVSSARWLGTETAAPARRITA